MSYLKCGMALEYSFLYGGLGRSVDWAPGVWSSSFFTTAWYSILSVFKLELHCRVASLLFDTLCYWVIALDYVFDPNMFNYPNVEDVVKCTAIF